MNNCFDKAKKNFGFGCMRLPMLGEEVDHAAFCEMVDAFMDAGFNYYDTATSYIGGRSETALKACLTSRYPRDSYVLTNKLSGWLFDKNEDIVPLLEKQLASCGVDYFDFYLMHAQDRKSFEKYKNCRAYETAFELKEQGKVKHVGISFHDTADVLDRILTEYPQIEVVQLQFNYLDYEDPSVQSRKCYEVCLSHNKPVMVMEPVKGGKLVNLPMDAKKVLSGLGGGSDASYAIRFAASFPKVKMVLSGMGNMDMMRDNISFMKDFKPLDSAELEAVEKVADIIRDLRAISCTECRYCVDDGCPAGINIPGLFADMNVKKVWNDPLAADRYKHHTEKGGKPSDCIGCGNCESVCPQHLPIRDLLKTVEAEFEK